MTSENERGDAESDAGGKDAAPVDEHAVASSVGSSDSDSDSDSDKNEGSFWKELPLLIGVALVLALIIKAFVVQAFYIPSESMQSTLQIGDRVLVNKVVYRTRDIRRGEAVVFNGLDSWDPEVSAPEPANPVSKVLHGIGGIFGVVPNERDYIKRVIGIPGDHVKCCDPQGRVTVNGTPLDETTYLYTDPVTRKQDKPSDEPFDVTVGQGRLWVMGDHRSRSADSRLHRGDPGGGTIPINRVIGRAFVVVWPLDRIDGLPIPRTFTGRALDALGPLSPAAPFVLGSVGAVPVAWLHRRRRANRALLGSRL